MPGSMDTMRPPANPAGGTAKDSIYFERVRMLLFEPRAEKTTFGRSTLKRNLNMTSKWLTTLTFAFLTAQAGAQEPQVISTEKEKISYGIGVDMARNSRRQGIDLDLDIVMKGLKDGLSGEKLLIPEPELRKAMIELQTEIRQKRGSNGRTAAVANRKAGEAFLTENKTREGVVTLPSGMQYKILKVGDGQKPTETNTVECYYRGTLLDGTEFFSSEAGRPGTFKVKDAPVSGWSEALKQMPVGSKWQLFIPPQLAYGKAGVGRQIGPDETIICELELMNIK